MLSIVWICERVLGHQPNYHNILFKSIAPANLVYVYITRARCLCQTKLLVLSKGSIASPAVKSQLYGLEIWLIAGKTYFKPTSYRYLFQLPGLAFEDFHSTCTQCLYGFCHLPHNRPLHPSFYSVPGINWPEITYDLKIV